MSGNDWRRRSPADWPFGDYFSPAEIAELSDYDRGTIIGYIERVLENHRRLKCAMEEVRAAKELRCAAPEATAEIVPLRLTPTA